MKVVENNSESQSVQKLTTLFITYLVYTLDLVIRLNW